MMDGVSQHSVDRLIRELIRTGRPATTGEIERIVERMAAVPFNREVQRVRLRDHGASWHGHITGGTADSSAYDHHRRGAHL